MRGSKIRNIVQEEIRNVLSEMDIETVEELPVEAGEHVKKAQYHLDQAQAELLGTRYEDEEIFSNLSQADRLLKRYLR